MINLGRIKTVIRLGLRKQQDDLRQNRCCIDLINTLWIILEQASEWNTILYVSFIDFEKVFDFIKRKYLLRVLRQYGIPNKMAHVIREMWGLLYKCQVIDEENLMEAFKVYSRGRQYCILSPTLFPIAMDKQ